MGNSVILLLIGGFISLISVLAGAWIQHCFEMRKLKRQMLEHPRHIMYEKQTEFFENLIYTLPKINSHIASVLLCLHQKSSSEAKEMLNDAASKEEQLFNDLSKLIDRFYMYIPTTLLNELGSILDTYTTLKEKPTIEKAEQCAEQLFKLVNLGRVCVGVDRLSRDLFVAFGKLPKELPRDFLSD